MAWQHRQDEDDDRYETPNYPVGDFRWRLVATGFWCRLRDAAAKRDAERDRVNTHEKEGGSDGKK